MGTITVQDSITAHPSSYDTTHYSYASIATNYPITNAYTDSSSTSYCQVNWTTGANAESYIYLKFNLSSIPNGATIKSVTAKAKGYVNTTTSSRVSARQMQLASGTSLKGSALTMSSTASEQTFSSVGSWTVAELHDAGVRFYVKRGTSNTSSSYNFRAYGATITVSYEYQLTTYEITVSNSTSATVTANPSEVYPGESSEIRSDTISNISIKDNGTDVTNQFVQRTELPASYTVNNVGSYGFTLNSNTGYYTSNNKGVSKSAAVCRIDFHIPISATVTFTYINYAEQGYDFGVFGNIGVPLSNDYYAAGTGGATITDTNYARACNTSTYNTASTQTLAYSMTAGDYSIWVKYSKDDGTNSNNDTLQFKIAIVLSDPSWSPTTYYGYDITNISADHTILVTSSAVDILYLKENGAWVAFSGVVYKNINGSWVQQSNLRTIFDTNTNYVKGN